MYFALAAALYAIIASLPFWTTKTTQVVAAIALGALTSFCWVCISRSVPPSAIPIYSLVYDVMLTSVFFLIPFFFVPFNLTLKQIIGAVLILIGLILIKL